MKTAYYTLTTQNTLALDKTLQKASGDERRVTWIRQPGQTVRQSGNPKCTDNVVSLAAWKAAQEAQALESAQADGPDWSGDEPDWTPPADEAPARRPRREHPTLPVGELAATLSVVGAAAAMVLQFLAF